MDFKSFPPTALPDLDMVLVKGSTFAMGDARGDLLEGLRSERKLAE